MPTTSEVTSVPTDKVGVLCVGGDWACAHGDLSALRYVAQCLAVHVAEPLHRELLALAEICSYDPDRAVERWMILKQSVREAFAR